MGYVMTGNGLMISPPSRLLSSPNCPRRRILVAMEPSRAATRRFLPTSPFGPAPPAPPAEEFAVQDQVTHDKYGLGRVVTVDDDAALVIDFGARRMRIAMPCAKLAKL